MKLVRSFKLMLLLPLVVAMLITLGIVYANIEAISHQFERANQAQTADLVQVQSAVDFTHQVGQVQEQLLQALEGASQNRLSRLQRYRAHTSLVEGLETLVPQVEALAYMDLLHKDSGVQGDSLHQRFSDYRVFAVQASEAVLAEPALAPALLVQALQKYLDFSLSTSAAGMEMVGSARARNAQRAHDFSRSNQRLLLVSVAVLLCVLLTTHMLTRRAGRDIVQITEGLGALTQNMDDAEALARVQTLRNRGSQEIQRMAEALLDFSQAHHRQHEAEEKAFELAFFDPLTKLPNRRMLGDRIRRVGEQVRRVHVQNLQAVGQTALLVLDLDDFKAVNDLFGHGAGDDVLREVAVRLAKKVPATSTVARIGGNAFAILLPNLTEGDKQVIGVAEKVMFALGRPLELGGKKHFLTASLGVSLFDGNLQDLDAPLKNAEAAMYQAKMQGRNKVQFYDAAIQAKLQEQLLIEGDLRLALERQQLQLYFQAQANAEQQIVGFEALVRWLHPERGMIPPGIFIPMAEGSDLILPIGHWVLRTACRQLQDWAQEPQRSQLTLAVNVSARQFLQGDFVNQVRAELDSTGINPRRLKLELTESLVLENVETTIVKMQELRQLGVLLSMDDFGTGYSSLQYLKRLPVDQLKIDQAFVHEITTNTADAAIAQTIVTMGQALGLDVIAEGVETKAQEQALIQLGCQYFQGYLYSLPLPRAEMEKLLQAHGYA